MFSDDVKQMIVNGQIGSFLHVITSEEANCLQDLAYKFDPGESKVVTFYLDKFAFAYYDLEMKYIVEAGEFNILIGNSSRDEDLKNTSFII